MTNGSGASKKKNQGSADSIGRAFAKDVEWKAFEARTKPYLEVLRDLRRLERHYLAQLRDYPQYALAIRRRIAENEFEQALSHGCTLSMCSRRLRAASQLGFESVERKAHFYLLYARGALARGHKQAAKQSALAIKAELERSLKKRKSLLGNQCLRLTDELLDFINKEDGS